MSALDTRHTPRDSMFMVAKLTFEDRSEPVDVRIRNLSATGMMAQTKHTAEIGTRVTVALRNHDDVVGTVAWAEGERLGIAFENAIDPKAARVQAQASEGTPSYARAALSVSQLPDPERRFRPV